MIKKLTAIVPFYNEGVQVQKVIDVLSQVREISQIIAVDDASSDNASEIISREQPKAKLIQLNRNSGKTEAVRTGFEKTKSKTIIVVDGDLHNLDATEISANINKFFRLELDMLVMRVSGGNNLIDRLLRKEIIFGGFRILKRTDLVKVFRRHFCGYQLEVAINQYMLKNHKTVAWTRSCALNVHKSQKWGFIPGYLKSVQMEFSILSFLGIRGYIQQVFKFCNNFV